MLTDMADVLRSAGLSVVELPGWKTRGEPGSFNPLGLLLHHDGMGLGFDSLPENDMNVPQYMARNGVNGSQLWVSRTGVWVVLAAGLKWHAGTGGGYGDIPANAGNARTIGVETDHTFGNPWPKVQLDSINIGSRALARHYGFKASNCAGHKEYAAGRKPDPESFDLNAWRKFIGGAATPAPAPQPAPTGGTYTVQSGDTLSSIAKKYGTTWSDLAALNKLSNPNVINVGQVLKVSGTVLVPSGPGKAAPSKPVPAKPYTPPPCPFGLPAGHYYGTIAGPAKSHGGFYAHEQPAVRWIQVRMQELGYAPKTPGWADGKYEQPTVNAVAAWQRARHAKTTSRYGEVWADDWQNLIKDR